MYIRNLLAVHMLYHYNPRHSKISPVAGGGGGGLLGPDSGNKVKVNGLIGNLVPIKHEKS